MIEFGHGTHVGLRRRCNEDTYYADPALGLFLVADGLGGHRHGERAASLTRDALVAAVSEGAALEDAIHGAGRRILDHARSKPTGDLPMGTTLTTLRLGRDHFEAAWVGDGRIYVWHRGLHHLSHGTDTVNALIEEGLLDAEETQTHPHRQVRTQALGVTSHEDLRIAKVHGKLKPGMQFLLCSDGLVDGLDDASIAAIAEREDLAAQECVDHLILAALDAGGGDNASAVLVRLR